MDTYGPIGYTYNKCSYCEDCLPDDVLLRRYLGVVVKMIPLFPWTKGEFPCEACGFVLPTDLPAETFERWRELGRERARGFDVEGILRDRYTVERTPEDVLGAFEERERHDAGYTNTQHAINKYGMRAAEIQQAFDTGLLEVFDAAIAETKMTIRLKITTTDIEALRDEAAASRDREMAEICEAALRGDPEANEECERVIRDTRARTAYWAERQTRTGHKPGTP